MWNDDLRVTFCTKGSAFEEGFFVPNTLLINILSGLDVIDGIDYEIQSSPEVVIEVFLVFLSYSQFYRFKVTVWIHFSTNSTSSLTLVLSNVFLSEQELSVEVTNFNIVIISDINFTISWSWYAHQCKHLNELTSESTGSDNKWTWVPTFVNEFVSKNNSVIVVPIFSVECLLSAFSGEYFEEFVMEPLSEWSVFTCKLDYFLSNDTAPEWTVWWNLGLSISGNVLDQVFINTFNLKVLSFNLHFLVLVIVNQLNQFLSLIFVKNSWKALMLGPEVINTVQDQMKLFWNTELFPTGNWHLHWIWRVWISQALFKIVEFHFNWDLGFQTHATIFIGWEFWSISNDETSWSFNFDLESQSIDLGHSLYFLELNGISIIKAVSLVFVQIDSGFLLPSDSCKMNKFWLFTSKIKDFMSFSKVNKSVSIKTEITGQNKTNFTVSAGLIELDQVFSVVIVKYNYAFEVLGTDFKIEIYMYSMLSLLVVLTVQAGLSSLSWVKQASARVQFPIWDSLQ